MAKKKTAKKKILSRDEKMLDMIREIQTLRPGWRFSLLGGDLNYGYRRDEQGKIIGVDYNQTHPFGWVAEFFGDIDPSICTGERHASSGHCADMFHAVLIACSQAKIKINAANQRTARE